MRAGWHSVPAAGTYVCVVHGDRTPSPIKLSHYTNTDAGAFAFINIPVYMESRVHHCRARILACQQTRNGEGQEVIAGQGCETDCLRLATRQAMDRDSMLVLRSTGTQ